MSDKPHSAEYFGDSRDHWWNGDFLALMAQRWRFAKVRMALDVGCGVGHWGHALSSVLPAEARVIGVDREKAWVARAAERAAAKNLGDRFSYRLGDATKLPFHDGVFDFVTCQTVLIHLPDPRAAIREMTRVLKPGGLLAVVEPNNLAGAMLADNLQFDASVDTSLELIRFQMVCERGKAALGEGHNSVGAQVPGYFAECGLENVEVYLSDKASPMLPPYSSPETAATVAELTDWSQREFFIWSREDHARYFAAGGGVDFERPWNAVMAYVRARQDALASGKYHAGQGGMTYLVSGRRPLRAQTS